ncbi:DUF5694 domain-containing protein, partial [Alkalibacillus haloalkaliphilus]|uniref:DUF5694 domain-containing protein n=1 Tax=Alkalibacillus haloalkaliphilus TaxID=94136 RepID=UPI001ED8FF20
LTSYKPTILVLGTDHFSNSDNGDLSMTQTEGILNGKRQEEIKHLIECLKRFQPTKVALEVSTDKRDNLNKAYRYFLNDDFQLTSNEVHQIGFRLAKESGLSELDAVDWNENLEGMPNLEAWATENESNIFKDVKEEVEKITRENEELYRNQTITDYLLHLNSLEMTKANHEVYMSLALMGSVEHPVGATWTAQYWYYRNMVIYKRLVDLIDSEHERVFVLYGAGHLHLLTQFLQESGRFKIETAEQYLRGVV